MLFRGDSLEVHSNLTLYHDYAFTNNCLICRFVCPSVGYVAILQTFKIIILI